MEVQISAMVENFAKVQNVNNLEWVKIQHRFKIQHWSKIGPIQPIYKNKPGPDKVQNKKVVTKFTGSKFTIGPKFSLI